MAASDSFVGLQARLCQTCANEISWVQGRTAPETLPPVVCEELQSIFQLPMGKGAYRLMYLSYCQPMLLGYYCYYWQRI